jgi:hypothetical protein
MQDYKKFSNPTIKPTSRASHCYLGACVERIPIQNTGYWQRQIHSWIEGSPGHTTRSTTFSPFVSCLSANTPRIDSASLFVECVLFRRARRFIWMDWSATCPPQKCSHLVKAYVHGASWVLQRLLAFHSVISWPEVHIPRLVRQEIVPKQYPRARARARGDPA